MVSLIWFPTRQGRLLAGDRNTDLGGVANALDALGSRLGCLTMKRYCGEACAIPAGRHPARGEHFEEVASH